MYSNAINTNSVCLVYGWYWLMRYECEECCSVFDGINLKECPNCKSNNIKEETSYRRRVADIEYLLKIVDKQKQHLSDIQVKANLKIHSLEPITYSDLIEELDIVIDNLQELNNQLERAKQ